MYAIVRRNSVTKWLLLFCLNFFLDLLKVTALSKTPPLICF